MSENKPKGVSWGEGLQQVKTEMLAPMPELPEVHITSLEELEAQAELVQEGITRVKDWVISTLASLDIVAKASRVAQELATDEVAKARNELAGVLRHETPAYRRAAWLAFFTHEFSREVGARVEAEAIFNQLVSNGYLTLVWEKEAQPEEPAGQIRAYGRGYDISSDALFGEEEVTQVKALVDKFQQRVYEAIQETRRTRAQNLIDQSTLTEEEFLALKPGNFASEVPPEEVKKPDGSTAYWRGGGVLLVEMDSDGYIHPVAGTASLQAPIEEARDMSIILKGETLKDDAPPFIKGLVTDKAKKIQLLWHLIQRGLRASAEKREMEAVKEEWVTKATGSDEKFFAGQPVIALLEYEGTWNVLNGNREVVGHITNIFFLVERFAQEEEGTEKRFIRLVNVPAHLSDYLAQCQGEYAEGEKFQGIPFPLIALLQAIYGQRQKAAHVNAKSGKK